MIKSILSGSTSMFGYVTVNEPELRIREYHLYRSYYCGMCMDLKDNYGQSGRMTLSYDTVFLALLLTSLYEPPETLRSVRCAVHPLEKHATRQNEYTRYAADMNIILSYYSCVDDWNDEKEMKKKLMANVTGEPEPCRYGCFSTVLSASGPGRRDLRRPDGGDL